ncbi:MAG: metallophosphoesterase [Cyclobacteriaceae bacterium]
MNRFFAISLFFVVTVVLDWYIFQAVRTVTSDLANGTRRLIYIFYWSLTFLSLAGILAYNLLDISQLKSLRSVILVFIFGNFLAKLIGSLFLVLDDVIRLFSGVFSKFSGETTPDAGFSPSRSKFLAKSALIATATPAAIMGFGIISGAYDYRIRKKVITLPNLPKAFDGIRLGQLSDIHSGSFFDKLAVKGGIDMLLGEKPDVIFFTGDLVNNKTEEVKDYVDIFNKLKAPLGVYSTLGNHDYGDYSSWSSDQAKKKNLQDLITTQKQMGWDILLNENRFIETGGEKIAILGIENWGGGRFQKYGDLEKTYAGSEEAPVKILLSHDPSHWDAQVRTNHPDIDLMLAGHTHGMQFGVEIGDFRWSPSQYIYKQWADLYQEGNQYLYVNRGFGFLGYPGRVGILPEITIIELKSA